MPAILQVFFERYGIQETAHSASVETVQPDASVSHTFIKFAGTPDSDQVKSVLQVTDGDYNLSGRNMTIFWRTTKDEFKTVMVGMALMRANIDIAKIYHHGKDISRALSKAWLNNPWPALEGVDEAFKMPKRQTAAVKFKKAHPKNKSLSRKIKRAMKKGPAKARMKRARKKWARQNKSFYKKLAKHSARARKQGRIKPPGAKRVRSSIEPGDAARMLMDSVNGDLSNLSNDFRILFEVYNAVALDIDSLDESAVPEYYYAYSDLLDDLEEIWNDE